MYRKTAAWCALLRLSVLQLFRGPYIGNDASLTICCCEQLHGVSVYFLHGIVCLHVLACTCCQSNVCMLCMHADMPNLVLMEARISAGNKAHVVWMGRVQALQGSMSYIGNDARLIICCCEHLHSVRVYFLHGIACTCWHLTVYMLCMQADMPNLVRKQARISA